MPKITKRLSTVSTMIPNDRPIVAGSAREKALKQQRISERQMRAIARKQGGGAPTAKRRTTTTTVTPKRKMKNLPGALKNIKSKATTRRQMLKKIMK